MFNSTLWGGIVVTVAAFLLIIGIDWIFKPQGDWTMIFVAVPVMLGLLYGLIRSVNRKPKQ